MGRGKMLASGHGLAIAPVNSQLQLPEPSSIQSWVGEGLGEAGFSQAGYWQSMGDGGGGVFNDVVTS